jgi:hypothetical protein
MPYVPCISFICSEPVRNVIIWISASFSVSCKSDGGSVDKDVVENRWATFSIGPKTAAPEVLGIRLMYFFFS